MVDPFLGKEMHINIGTDIIEIYRIEKAVTSSEHFLKRVFTPYEIEYANSKNKNRYATLAGMYAAKEAFVKALGTGFREGAWQEIEVGHTEWGAPELRVKGVFYDIVKREGYQTIKLSISHCKEYALAQVLVV